jgi:hypothetical protein
MDTQEFSLERLEAGKRFDESLQKLGLDAQVISWLYSRATEQFILYVVTDFFDFKGPLAVNDLFLKAYNASAIPHEIDPFTVEFHSIKHIEASQVASLVSIRTLNDGVYDEPPRIWGAKVGADFSWEVSWLVSKRLFEDRPSIELSRKWQMFKKNVDRIAA